MAPKAKKSSRAVRKASGKPKKGVTIEMVKQAITALGDRNGSTIKSIFSYMVNNKMVSQNSRTLVILAIGRGIRDGTIAKKTPKSFVVSVGGAKRKAAAPKRKRKTKRTKRSRKSSAKKSTKRRRRQRKSKTMKKKAKKSTKKSRKSINRTQKKRKARRSRKTKKTTYQPKPVSTSSSRRPVRQAARGKSYRQFY